MKTIIYAIITCLAGISLSLNSCGEKEQRIEARKNKGFRLPQGDVERGREAFVRLDCHHCHSVEGVELPAVADDSGIHFALGGEVRKVKTYGELVTSIIQPQHVVSPAFLATMEEAQREGSKSPMPDYNEVMTVREMVDLVVFLHAHYKKYVPSYEVESLRYY